MRLPRQIPFPWAMEILLTAEQVDPETALRMGLVNAVVAPGDLLKTARSYAERILVNAPLAIQAVKRSVLTGLRLNLKEAFEQELALAAEVFMSEDAKEGPRAFAEKRKPVWQGQVDDPPGGPLTLDYTEPSWADRRRVFIRERNRLNFATWLDRLVDLYGDRTAFALDHTIDYPGFSGDVLSYRDVGRLVNRMAHVLRELGVRKGDRVGLITINRIEMAFVNFAAGKIGAIPVPMNFMLRPSEIDYIMRKSGAELLVCDRTGLR